MTAPARTNDRYNAREAETRWQKTWAERGIFATPKLAINVSAIPAIEPTSPSAVNADVLQRSPAPVD